MTSYHCSPASSQPAAHHEEVTDGDHALGDGADIVKGVGGKAIEVLLRHQDAVALNQEAEGSRECTDLGVDRLESRRIDALVVFESGSGGITGTPLACETKESEDPDEGTTV